MSDKKYVLIVGASSGIGAATAKALSNDDTIIILVARREEQLKAVQKDLSGESMISVCDVRDYDQIQSLFDFIKDKNIKLSAMIYTAGICYVKPIKAMDAGELDKMFAVNVFGFYEMCRQFQSSKISEKEASIIAISSYASISMETGMSAYSMTKSAMNTAVQVMAKEFAKREIRVNAILPARTLSRMGNAVDAWSEEELEEIKSIQYLGAIPIEEITETINYLLSGSAKHITGGLIEISGGYKGI